MSSLSSFVYFMVNLLFALGPSVCTDVFGCVFNLHLRVQKSPPPCPFLVYHFTFYKLKSSLIQCRMEGVQSFDCIKMVVTMNPCKCGWHGRPSGHCIDLICSPIHRHMICSRVLWTFKPLSRSTWRRWFSWLEKLQTHIHLKFDNGLISEMAKEKPQDVLHILWLYIFIL